MDASILDETYKKNQLEYDEYRALNPGLEETVSLNIGDDNVFENVPFTFAICQVNISFS